MSMEKAGEIILKNKLFKSAKEKIEKNRMA
jgi:hypothetical protein